MNIIQVCNLLDDIKIRELVISTNLLIKVNSHLNPEDQLDFKLTGTELIAELDKLEIDTQTYANIISETLSSDEVRAFKKSVTLIKEQNRQKEEVSTQTKHTTVIVVVSVLTATLLMGCLVLYLNTKGVDVETSSNFIKAFVEITKVVLESTSNE